MRTLIRRGSQPTALLLLVVVALVAAPFIAARPRWGIALAVPLGALLLLLVIVGRAARERRDRSAVSRAAATTTTPAPAPSPEIAAPAKRPATGPAAAIPSRTVLQAAPGTLPRTVVPLTMGPTGEIDRVVLPLSARVVAAARHESCLFGGRVREQPLDVRGVSLRGFSHAQRGDAGQDAVGAGWLPHRQSLLAAAADGLGSRRDSGIVARRAIELVFECTGPDGRGELPLPEVLGAVSDRLRSDLRGGRLDGGTTLLIAELTMVDGEGEVEIAAVGDSEAWALIGGQWGAIYHDRDARGTKAVPGTSRVATRRARLPRGSVLVLATDGFAEALGSGTSRLAAELAARWRRPPDPLEFTNLVDFRDEYFLDDRSVVAVWIGGDEGG